MEWFTSVQTGVGSSNVVVGVFLIIFVVADLMFTILMFLLLFFVIIVFIIIVGFVIIVVVVCVDLIT